MNIKEKLYEKKEFNGVLHTTFNPYEPGVVRIHLIPPKFSWFKTKASVAIINGHDIIPVNNSWAILLSIFIKHVNKFAGNEITDAQISTIITDTVKDVKKIYGKHLKDEIIKSDLNRIINTFKSIALGKLIEEDIQIISIGEYAKYMTAPHRMDIMISSMQKNNNWNCNQKCIHCYAAGQDSANVEELSTEQLKKVIEKCRKIGIPQITFTGGEPTLRKDLVELVDYSKWFVTRVNTNGVLLTKELCEKLYKSSLDSIQITLYSNNPQIHNTLVGAENFNKTVQGIKNAINAGLNVSINTPLCKLNSNYVDTLKFIKELGVKYVSCSSIILSGNAKKEESINMQLNKNDLFDILKKSVEYCNDNLIEINFTSPGWLENDKFKELGIQTPSCGACLSNMAIAPNGDVVPCQSWLSKNSSLGNILTDDWNKIWNSKKCIKIRHESCKMKGICPLKDEKGVN